VARCQIRADLLVAPGLWVDQGSGNHGVHFCWAGLGVQLMPEKESAWWLNMVVRACWPVFLRDFLGRVVVPKLGPWVPQPLQAPHARQCRPSPLPTAVP